MEWTSEDEAFLRSYINNLEDDNNKLKHEIKQKLIQNRYICHVLDNKELEECDAEPEDYFGINILPYILVAPTQTDVANYLCYETRSYKSSHYSSNRNDAIKVQQIIFRIMCQEQNQNVTTGTVTFDRAIYSLGMSRPDLLAALIKREFNYFPFSGGKAVLMSDEPGVTDNNYAMRTLTFEYLTDASLIKEINGQQQMINKVWSP